ncbi:hypothetical protein [Vibrio parahaemolyticus]|uniref:hypothetical protein n=1 Tax=Vibrio parahaemolyticus TaxID=670 RepID=UPI00128F5C8B|nr:hypothetical protein [Vibrio parahaemolyticus]
MNDSVTQVFNGTINTNRSSVLKEIHRHKSNVEYVINIEIHCISIDVLTYDSWDMANANRIFEYKYEGTNLEDEFLLGVFDQANSVMLEKGYVLSQYYLHVDLSALTVDILDIVKPNIFLDMLRCATEIFIYTYDKNRLNSNDTFSVLQGQVNCAVSCSSGFYHTSKMNFDCKLPLGKQNVSRFNGEIMTRKLIIFGNGLGMALDAQHFSLKAALKDIWDKPDFLTLEQQQLIERCLGRAGAPEGEDELDLLHQAVTHCKSLNRIGDGDIHWLTEDGQSFPEITATYIHKVATKLHNFDGSLPHAFETALVDFIQQTKSHVATLNYDKLLYNSFIDNDLVDGYNGSLIDGMLNRGFSADALERKYDNNFGYYLHLHGSPLFMDYEGSIVKLSRDSLNLQLNIPSRHIVLTHVKHKPSVIAASHALSTYWDYLQFALSEAEEIILFGYSGFDTHLNMLLKPYLKVTPLRVVEWSGAGEQVQRETYWANCLGRSVVVERMDNISDFVAW